MVTIVPGLGLPAFGWLVFFAFPLLGYGMKCAGDIIQTTELEGFLEAVIIRTLWSALPLLITARLVKRALLKTPVALPSAIGAIAGSAIVEGVVWIVFPVIMTVAQVNGSATARTEVTGRRRQRPLSERSLPAMPGQVCGRRHSTHKWIWQAC